MDKNLDKKVEEAANNVDIILNKSDGEDNRFGFILIAVPTEEDNPQGIWISNMPRPEVIRALEEVAKKSKQEFISSLKKWN
jgi:hypothetical protein